MAKRTAEELVQEVEDYAWSYLTEVRGKHADLLPPLESEVRQFLGRVSGRPTAMTALVLARLEIKGLIKITRMGGDATVEVTNG